MIVFRDHLRWRALVLALGAGLLIPSSAPAQLCDDTPFGFIALRSQSPLQQLRFGLQHHRPWVTPDNELGLYFEHTWKNMWLYDPDRYRIDAEVHALSLRGCYGLGAGVEVALEIPVRYVSGGILDGPIEEFHDLFGIGNAGRDEFPRNIFGFDINPTGEPDDWRRAGAEQIGWQLGNAVLAASWELPVDSLRQSRAVITANVKVPTGTRRVYFGTQSVDVGLSLCVGHTFGPLHLYVSPGAVYYGQREVIGVRLYQWHFSGLVAAEYHCPGSRHSWIVQTLVESGIAEDFAQFSDNTYELVLGYKCRLNEDTILEIGFLENLFFFNNSPDFGLHLGVVRRFGH